MVIFDPLEEWAVNARSWFKKDYKVIHGDLDKVVSFLRLNFEKDFILIYVPKCNAEEKELDILSKIIIQAQNGFKIGRHSRKITFVADELDMGFKSGYCQRNTDSNFAFICKRGRHYGVNLVGISQRINQVDICFRGNLSAIFLFRMAESRDVATVNNYLGSEFGSQFKELNNYEYICKIGSQVIVKKK